MLSASAPANPASAATVDLMDEFQSFFDVSCVGLVQTDLDGRFVRVNPGFCDLVGYSGDELLRRTLFDVVHPENLPAAEHGFRQLVAGERVKHEQELRLLRKDGTPVWVQAAASLMRDRRGRPFRAAAVIQDITDRKAAVAMFEQQIRLFDSVASTTPDFVYVFDRQGHFLYANRRLLQVWGLKLTDVVGKTCRELGYEQWHHDMHMREIGEVIRDKKTIRGEVPFKAPLTGIYGIYEYIFSPVIGANGEVEVIAGTTRDVTARKTSEEALRQIQRRFNSALLAGEVGTFEWSIPDDRLWGDRNFTYIFGVELDASGAAPIEDFVAAIHPEDRVRVRGLVQSAVATGQPYQAEYRVIRRGELRWVIARGTGELDAAQVPLRFSGVIIDITDRKRAEEEFRSTFENAAVGIAHVSADGRIIRANRTLSLITGYPHDELIGKPVADITHPDDLAADLEQSRRVAAGEIDTYSVEKRYVRKDGSHVWANLTASVVRDSDGKPLYFIGVVEDITRRRNAEADLERAQSQLQQHAARLELAVAQRTAQLEDVVRELSTFSYSVSHDLRAPLRAITGFAEILLSDHTAGLSGEALDYLQRIGRASRKMDLLIRDVLAYSRISRTELQFENLDLEHLIRGIIDAQFQEHAARISLQVPLAHIRASRVAVEQCVTNLLGNAVKFARPGIEPRIVVGTDCHSGLVRVRIEDNGIGFPPECSQKIWGMFERLNPGIEGTGVGLAIVRRAVERMSGRVGVETTPGQGSTFWFDLPAATDSGEEARPDAGEGFLPLGR